MLFKIAVVDDLDAARALVRDLPDVTAVTREGDLLGAHFASGGSSSRPSLIEVQAAVDEATERLTAATHACERLAFDLARLEEERAQAQQRVDVALAKLHESDATLAAVAEELGQLGSLARSAKGEAERLATAIDAAEEARDKDLAGLADLEAAARDGRGRARRGARHRRAGAARRDVPAPPGPAEMDARLALRTAEERARALAGRADSLAARGPGRARRARPGRRPPGAAGP